MTPPAIEFLYVEREWDLVWERLNSGVLTQSARDTLYLIIHEKSFTRERGHRLMPRKVVDSLCLRCSMGTETISHKFLHCPHSKESWKYTRELMERVQPSCIFESDHSLLNLYFTAFINDNSVLWLLGGYLDFLVQESISKCKAVTRSQLHVYLQTRWLESQSKSLPVIGIIPGLEPSGIG